MSVPQSHDCRAEAGEKEDGCTGNIDTIIPVSPNVRYTVLGAEIMLNKILDLEPIVNEGLFLSGTVQGSVK